MKKWIKVIAFLSLFLVLFLPLKQIFKWKDTIGTDRFYNYPEDTMDVIFYGSSHTDCTIINAELWNNYGLATYNFSEHGQNIYTTYYYMEESLKTQSPKVMAVELTFASWLDQVEGNFYRNTLSLPLSKTSFENILEVTRFEGKDDVETILGLLFKFPVLHSRYSTISWNDFTDNPDKYSNYQGSWEIGDINQVEVKLQNLLKNHPDFDYVQKILNRMIQLADDNEIELIFWVSPFFYCNGDEQRFEELKTYLASKGFTLYNFNEMSEEIGFDYATDMRSDTSHVNNYGALKVTDYFGRLLSEEYQIKDLRNDKSFDSVIWKQVSDIWQKEQDIYEFQQIKDAYAYFEALHSMNDVVTIISYDGGTSWLETSGIQHVLNQYGIEKPAEPGDVYVFDEGQVVYSHSGKVELKKRLVFESFSIQLTKVPYDYEDKKAVFTNVFCEKNLSRKYENGFNVTVIDKFSGAVISNTGFDWIEIPE